MTVAADSLRLTLVEEIIQGTTPATPTMNAIRATGEGLTYEVTTTLSEELSGGMTRGIKDDILTGASVTGEINFELSKSVSFEALLEGTLGSDWGADPLVQIVPPTANQVIDSVTRKSYTIEKRFTTAVDTYDYHLFTGCVVDTMTLDITPGEPITGSFGFLGNEMTMPVTPVGTVYNDAGSEPIFTAPLVTGITFLERVDDSPVAWMESSCVTACSINITNNARGIVCIGTLGNEDVMLGRIEIGLTLSIYYTGTEPLEHLVDRKEFKFQINLVDSDGNTYDWLFDRVKISAASALASGTNTDVMTEMEVACLEGSPERFTVEITRSDEAVAPTAAVFSASQKSGNELGAKKGEMA